MSVLSIEWVIRRDLLFYTLSQSVISCSILMNLEQFCKVLVAKTKRTIIVKKKKLK